MVCMSRILGKEEKIRNNRLQKQGNEKERLADRNGDDNDLNLHSVNPE
jgi:hypothetical protein